MAKTYRIYNELGYVVGEINYYPSSLPTSHIAVEVSNNLELLINAIKPLKESSEQRLLPHQNL